VLTAFAFPFAFVVVFASGTSSSEEGGSDSSEEKSPKDISSSLSAMSLFGCWPLCVLSESAVEDRNETKYQMKNPDD
jgi:hypothetical protein